MTAVPYTTVALTRIRNGATATELGWDDNFYRSVCRKHGIPPNVAPPRIHTLAGIVAAVPTAPEPEPEPAPPVPAVDLPQATGRCIYQSSSRELRRGARTVTLRTRQAALLLELIKGSPSVPANGQRIAEHLGLSALRGIGGYIISLRGRMAPLNINIASRIARHHSGYWLSDLRSGKPLSVKVQP